MTSDQAELLKLAEEGIAAAQLLLDNRYSAFASSRAYYAMFAIAQALLLSKGLSYSKHSAVIAAFGQHFAKPGLLPVELHRYLLDAQKNRLNADYGSDMPIGNAEAQRDVERATSFLGHAQRFLDTDAGSLKS